MRIELRIPIALVTLGLQQKPRSGGVFLYEDVKLPFRTSARLNSLQLLILTPTVTRP